MFSVSDLLFTYKLALRENLPVLKGVSFNAEEGCYISIIGPSGCGKTTLLLCLSGLLEDIKGTIALNGLSPIEARRQHKIGFVFQKPVFFEWLTILDNIALPSKISGLNDYTEQAHYFLKKFRLDGFANSYPHELSGGMLSRVALARALVHEPQYLFLDEAFNHLDEALKDEINLDIQEIWLSKKITVIAITHSISEAVFMSDRIFVMSQKPSSIICNYQIQFRRPRKLSIRNENPFLELVEEIRQSLKIAHGGLNNVRI